MDAAVSHFTASAVIILIDTHKLLFFWFWFLSLLVVVVKFRSQRLDRLSSFICKKCWNFPVSEFSLLHSNFKFLDYFKKKNNNTTITQWIVQALSLFPETQPFPM